MTELMLWFYDVLPLARPTERYWPSFLAGSYLPQSVRGVRDSFVSSGLDGWLFWLIMLLPVVLLIGIVLWYGRKISLKSISPISNSPRVLFNELLGQLELSTEDKKLLLEMTHAARLKHPALCLLSPGMLDRTRQLWQQEKGPLQVPREKYDRIDHIAVQLYDHHNSQAIAK
ncbi:MAG: hypothetical protein KAT56_07955 [Sedimentisphaerales bacterium]|nr:hypothetical protein [Sedimentisphaerales bacterium]